MHVFKKFALAGATAGLLALAAPTPAQAFLGLGAPTGRASSYINPDIGAATANTDVDPASSCGTPDQYDRQKYSDAGSTARNVHNDACFLKGSTKVDGPATFESRGVGVISACPDPDGTGPKVAVLTDRDGDGRNDSCFQSGYQEKNMPGDLEFHARMNNNTGAAGTQIVTWCSDKNQNGCADELNRSVIRIDWSADGTTSFIDPRVGLVRSLLSFLFR